MIHNLLYNLPFSLLKLHFQTDDQLRMQSYEKQNHSIQDMIEAALYITWKPLHVH